MALFRRVAFSVPILHAIGQGLFIVFPFCPFAETEKWTERPPIGKGTPAGRMETRRRADADKKPRAFCMQGLGKRRGLW